MGQELLGGAIVAKDVPPYTISAKAIRFRFLIEKITEFLKGERWEKSHYEEEKNSVIENQHLSPRFFYASF